MWFNRTPYLPTRFAHMKNTGYVAELVPFTEWKSRLQSTADGADDPELERLAGILDSVERYLAIAGV